MNALVVSAQSLRPGLRESIVAQRMMSGVEADRSQIKIVKIALARLKIKPFREAGVDSDHVQRLVGLNGRWPPILVHQDNGLVIDGVHRAVAARLLGLERIDASLFQGGPDDALIEFVRRNVLHGLPLTLRERKHAAGRVLLIHPDWSDRRIAEICALSPKTVGRLRVHEPDCQSEEVPRLDAPKRVGRDNRPRPVNRESVRARVIEAIKEQPGASLRSVAAASGVSRETVRLVRMTMSDSVVAEPIAEDVPDEAAVVAIPRQDGRSPEGVLATREPREGFAVWLDRTCVSADECLQQIDVLPLGRAIEIADEARRRSEAWFRFAVSLNARIGELA